MGGEPRKGVSRRRRQHPAPTFSLRLSSSRSKACSLREERGRGSRGNPRLRPEITRVCPCAWVSPPPKTHAPQGRSPLRARAENGAVPQNLHPETAPGMGNKAQGWARARPKRRGSSHVSPSRGRTKRRRDAPRPLILGIPKSVPSPPRPSNPGQDVSLTGSRGRPCSRGRGEPDAACPEERRPNRRAKRHSRGGLGWWWGKGVGFGGGTRGGV